ncbi:MAG: hypothetical protein HDT22_06730 [Ruminococcus sp.]|nr:hypothetical protein [Ruminococcus sp.]
MLSKENFLKQAVILCDTREQKNQHILSVFDTVGVKYERKKLDFGDYSFRVGEKSFELVCAVERKASIDELWNNTTQDRERFEKEIDAMSAISHTANLLIENCPDSNFLRNYRLDNRTMLMQGRKVSEIGKQIYATLQAWSCPNRYGLNVHYLSNNQDTAPFLLNHFYYYYHNYNNLTKPLKQENRKFRSC